MPRKSSKKFERFTKIADFGRDLRGLGGNGTVHIKALKGSKFGLASEVRKLDADERAAVIARLRADGVVK